MPQNSKTAALRRKVASLIRNISVSQAADETPSGIGVMRKFAAYVQTADERLLAGIHRDMQTLAHTNPLFNQACEAVAMRKFAAEAEALADDQGISPEDAGAVLQASIANDPEAAQEFQGEVEGEAVGDLADAEAGALSEQNDLNEAAARASAATGEDVTPDDIEEAIATVEEAAAAQGVDPIDLISAAADQLQNSEDGGEDPEADALAEQLVQQASDEGISPEELIAGLSDDVTDDGSGCDDGSCEDDEDAEQAVKKEACLHNLAGTRRGQNVASLLANM